MSVQQQLDAARQAKSGHYPLRSRHLLASGEPRFTNRLILEDSPYLLQHAHNPVDWYPWSDEAFAAAQADNKPVFLSIGYATCHWCHVMEEESFDDEAVARLLNRYYISIKVDREQRPDLDDIYMTGVQLLTGQGGWPMSNILTPDGKPFFAATYLSRVQLLQLLQQVHQLWLQQAASLIESGEQIHQAIIAHNRHQSAGQELAETVFEDWLQQWLASEDQRQGGSGRAPKFPAEPQLLLLLDRLQRTPDPLQHPAWGCLQRALNAMLQGGIYDQLGGGFHRYATDAAWQVPHFEKMLYNQAQLALIYSRAWALSGEPEYRRIATETLDYLLAEMRSPRGGFYSATDADSEGREGRFFTWSYKELRQLCTAAEMQLLCSIYGVSETGNFEGANILHLPRPLRLQADRLGIEYRQLLAQLQPLKDKLYQQRLQRPPPFRDDKEISEWNAMVILALCEAGRLLQQPAYLEAAVQCGESIWQHSRTATGGLYRQRMADQASTAATLADYGYYLQALIALYDASGEPAWLQRARLLQSRVLDQFWDAGQGGFYNSATDSEGPLLVRSKAATDNTAASGNAATLMALVLLQQRGGELTPQIEAVTACYAAQINSQPLAFPALLTAIAARRQPAPSDLCYAAQGKVWIRASIDADGGIRVQLRIAEGWQINSQRPASSDRVATELAVADARQSLQRLCYSPAPKAHAGSAPHASNAATGPSAADRHTIFRGELEIRGQLSRPSPVVPPLLQLTLQACNERLCLAAETLQLRPARV